MLLWVGIDVAKATLAVHLHPDAAGFSVANTPEGHAELLKRLRDRAVGNVLLEASGGYERTLMRALADAGLPATRINPKRARAFATAMGKLAKTDPADATVLARMAALLDATHEVPNPHQEELRRRLKQADSPRVRTTLAEHIGYLNTLINALGDDIARARRRVDDPLASRLLAIPGIGAVTVASLLAHLPELGRLDRRQIAALAGLAPYSVDSGQVCGKRRIRGGRTAIRRVLYMASLSVIRKQEDFRARHQRLCQQGKPARLAITACMRVLLIRMNAMAHDQTDWVGAPV